MKYNLSIFFILITACFAAVITPAITTAQITDYGMMPQQPDSSGTGMRQPLIDVTLESSYTAAGKTRFGGATFRDSDAYNVNIGLSARTSLNEHWIIPFELRSQNLYFGSLDWVPLPKDIHTLQFGTGLGYRPNDRWIFMARLNPTLYKFSDFSGNDVGVSGGLTAMWNYSPSLKLMFGFMYSPDSDLKLLPMVGVDWAINEEFDLRLMFPKPRLIYKPNDRWRFHVGADINMAIFRTSDSLGTSIVLAQYNDALGTYRDIRVGVGGVYLLKGALTLEADAGYSVSRQIDYTRIDERVEFDPAPYVGINLRWRF